MALVDSIPADRLRLMFPKLTPGQIKRIQTVGNSRKIEKGELLVNQGDPNPPFMVIVSGEIEIVQPTQEGESVIVVHQPGDFTGEMALLSGRRSLVCVRASKPGEVIQLDRHELQALVQNDVELSEIVMRAFILRRLELIAKGAGDVILIGSVHSPDTLRIKGFLSRNGHPYSYVDLDQEKEVQGLFDRFHVSVDDVPVVICRGSLVLRNPSNQKVADCVGLNPEFDEKAIRDVVVVGAGPSGLAAAVYAASEGLNVLVLETNAPGGQAGSSSKIENYLGFPLGISGQELAGRAYSQAQKFGADIMIARSAIKLGCSKKPYVIQIDGGITVPARSVVIASGARYHKPEIENLSKFEGIGVYYGATKVEAQYCGSEEVIVIGGGNSAGQAAVFLSEKARHVHMVIRSAGLADTMSRYLIRRIEESPRITLHTFTEVEHLDGDDHVQCVRWRNRQTGKIEVHNIRHVFVMCGADPNSGWLDGCLALDDNGFLKTGTDLQASDLEKAQWPLARQPFLLETSRPGVFAVGDVRAGNVKRVASAVGEGSISIHLVHKILAE